MSDAQVKEKVEVLNGERGNKADAAARLRHLQALVTAVPASPSARAVTAAPTADDYNALLDDVRKIYDAMNAIRVLVVK